MQAHALRFVYIILFKYLIICKQKCVHCFHFSKLIPFICKTLGFMLRNPCFQSVISWVSEAAPMHQKNEYLCSSGRTGRGDHRPTLICLAHHMNSSFFTRHLTTPCLTLRVHLLNVVFFHKIHKLRNLNPQITEFKSINYGI